jgi:hypothetical protein
MPSFDACLVRRTGFSLHSNKNCELLSPCDLKVDRIFMPTSPILVISLEYSSVAGSSDTAINMDVKIHLLLASH